LNIRRPKKKLNVLDDKRIESCLSRFDSGAYSRLQFLRAVNHSVSARAESLQPRIDNCAATATAARTKTRTGGACASSANFRGVGIGNGSRGNNLGLFQSVHRGATC